MTRQYEFVEGFRITRDPDSLLIEATDYHAQPLRLYGSVLFDLGIRLVEARDAVDRRPKAKKKKRETPTKDLEA